MHSLIKIAYLLVIFLRPEETLTDYFFLEYIDVGSGLLGIVVVVLVVVCPARRALSADPVFLLPPLERRAPFGHHTAVGEITHQSARGATADENRVSRTESEQGIHSLELSLHRIRSLMLMASIPE